MAHEAGKGSKPRPYKTDIFRQNYDRIFRRDSAPDGVVGDPEQPKRKRVRPRKPKANG